MELSWICPASDNEFRRVPADLSAEAERAAKAALADSDMCVPIIAAIMNTIFCSVHSARRSCLPDTDMLAMLQGGLIWVTISQGVCSKTNRTPLMQKHNRCK